MDADAALLLVRALRRRDDTLSDAEASRIRALRSQSRPFRRHQELVAMGQEATECCLVAEGFVARAVALSEGDRQICSIHVPGDFVDLHGLLLKVMDHSIVAMSPGRAVFIPHGELVELTRQSPHLTRLLWMLTVIDAAIQRTWIACLGRRSARHHLGHLICELYLRLEAVGLASDHRFPFPLTQTELADILGISPVHANRSVQQLRAKGLISWGNKSLRIDDFDELAAQSEFDPTYLNLARRRR